MTDIVERLRKMAVCIYIAVEKSVADDVADGLHKAADEIERLRTSREQLRAVVNETGRELDTVRVEIERLRDEKAYLMRVVNMDSDAVTEIERLRAALRQVVSNIEDYERMNNLAPNPGRKYCWDSVAHAHDVLGDAP